MWAAEAKGSEAWNHTSLVVATILNARDGLKRHQQIDAQRIHPYARKNRRAMTKEQATKALDSWSGTSTTTQ